ncbi:hypothetical protein BAE44_0009866 [Dichanthelium oligosanthes]|uniref:DUF4220 domain-containing protein n=1 Tax=Dichanthelium oligosanthes TaxID=888268 RepID=A0A1E5VVL4_9POAL|nr:hypothetical protein BAE44_0009866 [Dichanthelium oligosanthes]
MHLGGQDGITAYNIEDNELWMRHVLTAFSQVTVAIYVFWKSWTWPDEKPLWKTTLLVFVPGMLKCFEKPWALKNASITSLTTMSSSVENVETNSLEAYVEAARQLWRQILAPNDVDRKPYTLFVDIVHSYDDRLRNMSYMVCNKGEAYDLVQSELSSVFDRLYTKERVFGYTPNYCGPTRLVINRARFGSMLRYLVAYLSVQAIGVFYTGNYSSYNSSDVKVTSILLWGTTALEYLIANVKPFLEWWGTNKFKLAWPNQVAQYNLIGYMTRNRRHKGIRKLAALLGCKDTLDQLWFMEPCWSSRDVTSLVYDHVRQGWRGYIRNTATYISFNNSRGQRTLEHEEHLELLVYIINRPFDETVLLWHLATDFCFHYMDVNIDDDIRAREMSRTSRQISNYLMYLLFVNPEMLMTGTRSNLFKTTYGDLKRMIRLDIIEEPALDERGITERILQEIRRTAPGEGGLIRDAFGLANALMGVGMEAAAARWRIIRGVWVEMLCFSAGRCRGYLHAKGLGKGGEYLSHVWLLLSRLGMETLAERLQRTEQPVLEIV